MLDNNLGISRFGFIAGKKVSKKAVDRNTAKRRLRSCIEEKWLGLLGKDVLFVLKNKIVGVSREDLCKEMDSVMEKIKES